MTNAPRPSALLRRLGVVGGLLAGGVLQAQDPLESSGPTAVQTELLPGGLDAKYDGEGFLFGIGVNGIYDSNLFLAETNERSDFSIAASPWVLYRNAPEGGARYTLSARYSPFLRIFFDNDDLNAVDHSGNATLSYNGEKTTVRANVLYNRFSQSDRFAGTFVEASTLSYGVNGSYKLSEKTSFQASWTGAMTDYESSRLAGADTYSAQLTAFWQATPLLRIGPSIRHTETESRSSGTREAYAFLLSLAYTLTDKVNLSASAGVEFEENSRAVGTGTEAEFTGSLSLDYRIDELWSLRATGGYRTIPSPTTTNYLIEDLSFSASVSRDLSNGGLSAGVAANFSNYEPVGPVTMIRSDDEAYSFFLSHSIGLLDDRVNLDSSVRFSTNSGSQSWDRFQVSTGLSYVF